MIKGSIAMAGQETESSILIHKTGDIMHDISKIIKSFIVCILGDITSDISSIYDDVKSILGNITGDHILHITGDITI